MSSWSEGTGSGAVAAAVLPAPKQIRFVNNEGRPPAKRRRVDAACQTCRKRKIRCDGKRPQCSTCRENRHECLGYSAAPLNATASKGPDVKRESIDEAAEDDDVVQEDVKPNISPPTKNRVEAKVYGNAPEKARASGESASYEDQQPDDALADSATYNDDGQTSQGLNRRVPYFRWFGPTAIVRGFKQMVVSVREPRRSMGPMSLSSASPLSTSDGGTIRQPSVSTGDLRVDLPLYDINDAAPVPMLIMELVKTFFAHLGCNFPFLRRDKVLRMVEGKRLAPILVNAICALAARFSDNPQLVGAKRLKSDYGQVFARRAKAAVTDTFLCPTVEALQACLLLAYEAFGDDKDSALWMYTGCAIRMAFDLGLEKLDGIRIQRDRGPNYSPIEGDTVHRGTGGHSEEATLEQKASEQERIDTLWAIFTLDRFISSGLGRPATMRREDFELQLPVITKDPKTDWPAPLPALIQIIHLYGRVSDLLNGIKNEEDVTEERLQGLADMEDEMMTLYHSLDPKLTFKPEHFQHYVKVGEGTNFILLHFWFHTLIMVVHCPMLWNKAITQLLPNNSGREYSMSSAKTIADILSFAEILDPKGFIGNPFTSQPMYFAASAFLIELNIHKVSVPTSREGSPRRGAKSANKASAAVSAKQTSSHYRKRQAETRQQTLHAYQAAKENYQRCYKALEQLETYWAGTKYILTALNQKAIGITDPETFTTEEMESTKIRPGPLQDWKRRISTTQLSPGMKSVALSMSPKTERSASPMLEGGTTQPICWSLTGTTNSPSSNLTWMYQPQTGDATSPAPASTSSPAPSHKFYDPIRSSVPEPIRATSATATATTTYSSYNVAYPPLHPPMHPPQHPQQQMPMPHIMPAPPQKYGTIMDDPPALSDAKMLLELQHSPHSYNRVTPTAYGGAGAQQQQQQQQASTEAAQHMQQGHLYDGTERYDFAAPGAGAGDMVYQGWAMSGFIGTGLGISGGGGDMMLSTREIDMYNLDNEMLTWVGDVEYLPQDTMMSFDTAAANMNRYGNG